jgi:hypothetical protein
MMASEETKQDVFEELLDAYDDAKSSDGNLHPTQELLDYDDRYADALPDDLPVIPKVVGGLIKRLKSKPDSTLFDAVDVDHMVYEYDYKWRQAVDNANWIDDHADTFARAWLLGAWKVEETGEIVKLEADD